MVRHEPLLFLTMNKIHENQWLLQMIRTTPFDGQLMICGPENYTACWVPIDPTSVDRSSGGGAPSTEGTSLSEPISATDPIPDSRISMFCFLFLFFLLFLFFTPRTSGAVLPRGGSNVTPPPADPGLLGPRWSTLYIFVFFENKEAREESFFYFFLIAHAIKLLMSKSTSFKIFAFYSSFLHKVNMFRKIALTVFKSGLSNVYGMLC